jgi:hypothetical protein
MKLYTGTNMLIYTYQKFNVIVLKSHCVTVKMVLLLNCVLEFFYMYVQTIMVCIHTFIFVFMIIYVIFYVC